MANAAASFILGVLTVIVIGAGVYLYMDFAKSETRVANYDGSKSGDTYIYDKDGGVLEEEIDESIDEGLGESSIPAGGTFITGKLCYPSHFLPPGEIVAKNTATMETTMVEFDGTNSEYKIGVEPGTYILRYQAHLEGDDDFSSGYYTKCGIDSSANICNADDGHDLILVEVSAGETAGGIDLCDFYYAEEPEF